MSEQLFETHVTPESGLSLSPGSTGDPIDLWRVKYRPLGTRRWTSFLIARDDPTLSTLNAMLAAHVALRASDGR